MPILPIEYVDNGVVVGWWPVRVSPQQTVRDLKRMLASEQYSGIIADDQKIAYCGQILEDPDTLASYGITADSDDTATLYARSRYKQAGLNSRAVTQKAWLGDLIYGLGSNAARVRTFKAIPKAMLEETGLTVTELEVVDFLLHQGVLGHVKQKGGVRLVRDFVRGGIERCQPDMFRSDDDEITFEEAVQSMMFQGEVSPYRPSIGFSWPHVAPEMPAIYNRVLNLFHAMYDPAEIAKILQYRLGMNLGEYSYNSTVAVSLIRSGRVAIAHEERVVVQPGRTQWRVSFRDVWYNHRNARILGEPLLFDQQLSRQLDLIGPRPNRPNFLAPERAIVPGTRPSDNLDRQISEYYHDGIPISEIPRALGHRATLPQVLLILSTLQALKLLPGEGEGMPLAVRTFNGIEKLNMQRMTANPEAGLLEFIERVAAIHNEEQERLRRVLAPRWVPGKAAAAPTKLAGPSSSSAAWHPINAQHQEVQEAAHVAGYNDEEDEGMMNDGDGDEQDESMEEVHEEESGSELSITPYSPDSTAVFNVPTWGQPPPLPGSVQMGGEDVFVEYDAEENWEMDSESEISKLTQGRHVQPPG